MSHDEPDEEQRAEATDAEAQEGGSPLEQQAEEDTKARDEFRPWDDLHEAFGDAAEVRHVIADDGLPTQAVDNRLNEAMAHPFTEDKFVCIADRRSFVVRGMKGRIIAKIDPRDVTREPDGRYYAPALAVARGFADCCESEMASKSLHEAIDAFVGATDDSERAVRAVQWLESVAPDGAFAVLSDETIKVEPIRPQCKHLLQQIDPPPVGTVGFKRGYVKKFCALRRTLTGAFMGLSDEAVTACSMRDPHDAPTAAEIDESNAEKIAESRNRVFVELFDTHPKEAEQSS